ncbi:MAG: type II toxin-antitoxin system RelE/ParE family toxin [Deltaproteobacteria bacterium]|nr:type II toxin-antitoxin system RelE/ParE family toxin [Deltaproteobacteria bacterium]
MKVVWTNQAYARLAAIRDYVARDSVDAAERLVEKLVRKGERLAAFPESGRRVPELPVSQLRELVDGNYRIVYRIRGARVQILTVFEAHRLFPGEDVCGGATFRRK